MSNIIEAGLELIKSINATRLTPQELRSILHNLITKDWVLVNAIVDAAVKENILERSGWLYKVTREASEVKFSRPKIEKVLEPGVCNRCGKRISVCYYATVGSRTYGPFGSMCIRKVRLME